MNKRRWVATAVAGAMAAVATTALAAGAVTTLAAAEETIKGCYRTAGVPAVKGQLRVLAPGQRCARNERAISWNQRGPQGAPGLLGAAGQAGDKGELGAPGPQGGQGTQGAIGAVGAQGAVGATGLTGDIGVAGPRGASGATGVTGPVGALGPKGDPGGGVVWRGDFDSLAGYGAGDLVRWQNNVWMALRSTFLCNFTQGCRNVTPGENATVWQLFAADGAKGDTGATGPAGPPGETSTFLLSSVTVSSGEVSVGGSFPGIRTATVTCPAGRVVTGGGFHFRAPSGVVVALPTIASSHAVGDSGWKVEALGHPIVLVFMTAWATCARLN